MTELFHRTSRTPMMSRMTDMATRIPAIQIIMTALLSPGMTPEGKHPASANFMLTNVDLPSQELGAPAFALNIFNAVQNGHTNKDTKDFAQRNPEAAAREIQLARLAMARHLPSDPVSDDKIREILGNYGLSKEMLSTPISMKIVNKVESGELVENERSLGSLNEGAQQFLL